MTREGRREPELLIIVCHPVSGSFTHAAAGVIEDVAARYAIEVRRIDLYDEAPSPVLSAEELQRGMSFDETILEHQRLVTTVSRLAVVHPDWWGGPPALLKGWVERVFRAGVAYRFTGEEFMPKVKQGLLGQLSTLVAYTTDAPRETAEQTVERFWQHSVFAFCGVSRAECHGFYEMHSTGPGARTRRLREFEVMVRRWLGS